MKPGETTLKIITNKIKRVARVKMNRKRVITNLSANYLLLKNNIFQFEMMIRDKNAPIS